MTTSDNLGQELALINAIYRRTVAGSLDWKESRDPNEFRARFRDVTLAIVLLPDEEYPNEPDYELRVIDHRNRVVESVSNISLRPVSDHKLTDNMTPYDILRATLQLARRQALGTDQVISKLLEELESP